MTRAARSSCRDLLLDWIGEHWRSLAGRVASDRRTNSSYDELPMSCDNHTRPDRAARADDPRRTPASPCSRPHSRPASICRTAASPVTAAPAGRGCAAARSAIRTARRSGSRRRGAAPGYDPPVPGARADRPGGGSATHRKRCRCRDQDAALPDRAADTARARCHAGVAAAAGSGDDCVFQPGQYLDVLLEGGRRRSFSIASPPHDSELLELHVRRVAGGGFTERLFEPVQRLGALLRIEGPVGQFIYRARHRPACS